MGLRLITGALICSSCVWCRRISGRGKHGGEVMSKGQLNTWWRKLAVAAVLPLAAMGVAGCDDPGEQEEQEEVEEGGY